MSVILSQAQLLILPCSKLFWKNPARYAITILCMCFCLPAADIISDATRDLGLLPLQGQTKGLLPLGGKGRELFLLAREGMAFRLLCCFELLQCLICTHR